MNSKEKRLDGEKLIIPLHEILSEEGKKKLADILTFWDALKEKWAEARKKFWSQYDRGQFLLQLRHAKKGREEMIKGNHQKLEEIWFFTRWKKKQEKFIAEYLRALSHYGEIMEEDEQEEEEITLEEITLEEVQESGFKEWVFLDLSYNHIWDEWAKALSKMELKEWVTLKLSENNIWDEWAKALSKLELKEWVTLYLEVNKIWDEWAKALSKMELKDWVTLDLRDNNICNEWRSILENWVADAKARGINCEVLF